MPIINPELEGKKRFKTFFNDYQSREKKRSRYQSARVITQATSSVIVTILGYSLTGFKDDISLNATRAINLVILSLPVIVGGLEQFYSRQISMLTQRITEAKNYGYAHPKKLFVRAEDIRESSSSSPSSEEAGSSSSSSSDAGSSGSFYSSKSEQVESASKEGGAGDAKKQSVLDLSKFFPNVPPRIVRAAKRLEELLDEESENSNPRPIQEIFEEFVKKRGGSHMLKEFQKAAEYVKIKFGAEVDLNFDKGGKIVTKGMIHTIELYKNLKAIDLRNGLDNLLKSLGGMLVTVLGFVVFVISMEASDKRTSKDMTPETKTQRAVEIINLVIAATPVFVALLIAFRAAWANFCWTCCVPARCAGPKETSVEDAVKNLKKTAYESNLLKNPLVKDAVGSMTRAFSP